MSENPFTYFTGFFPIGDLNIPDLPAFPKNIITKSLLILADKCHYPFKSSTEALLMINEVVKSNHIIRDVLRRQSMFENDSGVYVLIEASTKDVLSVLYISSGRIDRIATKKGEENKGYATMLLKSYTETLSGLYDRKCWLGATVDRAIIPLFEKCGWKNIYDCSKKIQKIFVIANGNKNSPSVPMIIGESLEFFQQFEGKVRLTEEMNQKHFTVWTNLSTGPISLIRKNGEIHNKNLKDYYTYIEMKEMRAMLPDLPNY